MSKKETNFVRLRSLIYFDSVYEVYLGQCLETGGVVTADDPETAESMMTELLEDEVSYAIKYRNFANLFSKPAPAEIWTRWYEAAKKGTVKEIALKIDAEELRLDEREVPGEVEMACA